MPSSSGAIPKSSQIEAGTWENHALTKALSAPIEGLETEAIGFITNYGDKNGVTCKCDKHFHDEFERFKEKKPKKALDAINELIKRNPYNELYIDSRNDLVNKFPTLKK